MGAAEDDQAKRGQLLRKALAKHIRFAKKTDQVRLAETEVDRGRRDRYLQRSERLPRQIYP